MDDKFALQTLKSSDSMNHELLYKEHITTIEKVLLFSTVTGFTI